MNIIQLSKKVEALGNSYVQIQTNSGPWFGIISRMLVYGVDDAVLEVLTEGKKWRIPAKTITEINKKD